MRPPWFDKNIPNEEWPNRYRRECNEHFYAKEVLGSGRIAIPVSGTLNGVSIGLIETLIKQRD